ncbi:hypothetical protein [Streptomyces sp. NPDC052107]|uniref:hypothetical protein n=1 Tax=Streptomyces sp. NPDC052107 TaxID=3155632 RepID=UPI00342C19A1
MTVNELLARHAVDPARLDPAPAEPSRAEMRARYALHWTLPCTACGMTQDCRTSRSILFPRQGHRWVDLCRDDSLATMPRWTGPTTIEGILAELCWAAGTMSFMDEPGHYHLLLTSAGQPVQHGWWGHEETARSKFSRWIGEYSGMPAPRVTLTDEETGTVLTTWPTEP